MKVGRSLAVAGQDFLILVYVTIGLSPLSFFLSRSSSKIWDYNWGAWIKTFQDHGLVGGFYAVNDVYPPLTFSLLAGLSLLKGDTYLYFKFAQLLATFVSALMILIWSRNVFLAVGVLFALAPNSIVFESIDIFYTPLLLGALIAASGKRWAWFSALYTGAVLIKFQPIVLAPLLLIWIAADLRSASTWVRLILPACLVALPVVIVFGPQFPLALIKAMGASLFFSGDAYNVDWLAGSLYGLSHWPDANPSSVMPLMTDPRLPHAMWTGSKLLSFASYAFIVLMFAAGQRDQKNLFLFCGLAMLSYFMLHTEVHENHLHVVLVCFALLAGVAPNHQKTFAFWSAAQAVNLMLIFTGWPRAIAGLDWTLFVAAANLVMFAALYFDTVRTAMFEWIDAR